MMGFNRDVGLLIFRLWVGGAMFFAHGLPKLLNFTSYRYQFPDPLGFGVGFALSLTIFAEVVCSFAIILGFKLRFACVPPFIAMVVAFAVIHGNDPWSKKELAAFYGVCYIVLFLVGSGRYAMDQISFKSGH